MHGASGAKKVFHLFNAGIIFGIFRHLFRASLKLCHITDTRKLLLKTCPPFGTARITWN